MRGTSLGTGAKAEGWLIRDIGDFRLAAREAADGEEEMVLGEFWEESEAEGGLCSDRKSVEKEAWKSARCGEIMTSSTSNRGLDVIFLLKTPHLTTIRRSANKFQFCFSIAYA